VLDSLLGTATQLYVVGDVRSVAPGGQEPRVLSADDQFVRGLLASHAGVKLAPANQHVAVLRGTKSPAELDLIRKAVTITVEAQREAMRAMEPGMNEFEIQSLIEYTFRRNGADRPSFSTIVGSGPNSTTLHYNADDRFMNAGEVVVMDIGASYRGYAADVTRTVPVSGTFTPDQRAIYQIVRDAQAAAERQAKLGAKASRASDSSSRPTPHTTAGRRRSRSSARSSSCTTCTGSGTASVSRSMTPISSTSRGRSRPGARSRSSPASTSGRTCSRFCRRRRATTR
jgi:Xaa-Pro aminopeptidase